YVNDLTDSVDCILLGRNMTDGFISYWKSVTDPADPQYDFAKKMCDYDKVVFSKTLNKSEWENTRLASGDITEEVNRLKNLPGKDIIVYGGAGFVSGLIKNNLIDEYYLFINPAVTGEGMTIYKDVTARMNLKLTKAVSFSCGIVVLCYQPIKQ
ncbi:MAG: dihydrofolate reductase family protein, partial [Sphingobacteriales bacterium]